MYTLYWGTRTGAFIPDAILAEMGQPVTRIKVKRTDGRVDDPAFEAISPMKQIPCHIGECCLSFADGGRSAHHHIAANVPSVMLPSIPVRNVASWAQ